MYKDVLFKPGITDHYRGRNGSGYSTGYAITRLPTGRITIRPFNTRSISEACSIGLPADKDEQLKFLDALRQAIEEG